MLGWGCWGTRGVALGCSVVSNHSAGGAHVSDPRALGLVCPSAPPPCLNPHPPPPACPVPPPPPARLPCSDFSLVDGHCFRGLILGKTNTLNYYQAANFSAPTQVCVSRVRWAGVRVCGGGQARGQVEWGGPGEPGLGCALLPDAPLPFRPHRPPSLPPPPPPAVRPPCRRTCGSASS